MEVLLEDMCDSVESGTNSTQRQLRTKSYRTIPSKQHSDFYMDKFPQLGLSRQLLA